MFLFSKSREAPSFSLLGSAEGGRVLMHAPFIGQFGPPMQVKFQGFLGSVPAVVLAPFVTLNREGYRVVTFRLLTVPRWRP
jgi:hypothetical protein